MGYFLGIDVGGTNIRIVILEQTTSKMIAKETMKFQTDKDALSEVRINVSENIKKVYKKKQVQPEEIIGVGVALAANFSKTTGVIKRWSNHKTWEGFPIWEYLQDHICPNIYMEDDANCAAIGEHYFGNAKGVDDFIYITISTGVGCGIVMNSELLTGKNGLAGELGHIKMGDPRRICTCQESGCLQATISGPAIKQEIVRRHKLKAICIDETMSLEKIVANRACDSILIREVFQEAADILVDVIVTLERLLDIHDFVLGGGVIKQEALFFQPLTQSIENNNDNIVLHKAKQNNYNGALGAIINMIRRHK